MSCVEAAEVALRILHQLVRMQAAVDPDGNPCSRFPSSTAPWPLPNACRTLRRWAELSVPPCPYHFHLHISSSTGTMYVWCIMSPHLATFETFKG